MKKNNKGFTLVELIVVLVILAILAAILTPALLGYIDRARSEKDYSTAQTIRVAAQAAIDQAYGDGKFADGTAPAAGTALSISNMTGLFTATVSGTTITGGTYAQQAFNLASVDTSKVTGFKFKYENGIITTGYVKIDGHFYYLSNGAWTVNKDASGADAEPTIS